LSIYVKSLSYTNGTKTSLKLNLYWTDKHLSVYILLLQQIQTSSSPMRLHTPVSNGNWFSFHSTHTLSAVPLLHMDHSVWSLMLLSYILKTLRTWQSKLHSCLTKPCASE